MRQFALLSLLSACATAPAVSARTDSGYSRTILIHGSPLTVTINEPGLSVEARDNLFKKLEFEATSVDAVFFSTGGLELLNAQLSKGTGPFVIRRETGKMLADVLRAYRLTAGVFDPTVGPVIRAWIEAGSAGKPSATALKEALKRTGADKMTLAPDMMSIRTSVPGMRVEPRGMRDGWVVKSVVDNLQERRLVNFMVNFRGACWHASGVAPGDKPWRVLVNDHRTRRAGYIALEDQSLSVSVSQVPRPDGRPGSKGHIVDPRDGSMVGDSRLVAAVAANPLDAEILSTAGVVLGQRSQHLVTKIDGGSMLLFTGPTASPQSIGQTVRFEPVKSLDHGTLFEEEVAWR